MTTLNRERLGFALLALIFLAIGTWPLPLRGLNCPGQPIWHQCPPR